MLKNYFKIAIRNLLRNKGFSLTNLLGLTLGITCAIFIFLWVKDELLYNKFHYNYQNIHVVVANRDFKNRVFTDYNMVLPFAQAIEGKNPQIKHAVVTTQGGDEVVAYGDTKLKKRGMTVSEYFFDVFSFKALQGNFSNFKDPSQVIITRSMAKAVFGNQDPLNKMIKLNNEESVMVKAVMEDIPANSTIQFDFVQPFNYTNERTKRMMENWNNSSWRLYLLTNPGANLAQVDNFVNGLKKQHSPNDNVSTYFTFPMAKWRLHADFKDGKNVGGLIEYVRLFSIIAIVILVIACINFMNLSTARSEKRSKEVGIRKTLGSLRGQILLQFFIESILLVLAAFLTSLAIVYLMLPAFNLMVDKNIQLHLTDPIVWMGGTAIILFTGLLAGSYPALYLSSFNPVKVLKGTFHSGRNIVLPRHLLVIGQFSISMILITATIIVYLQIQHIKHRNMGYNPQNLLMVRATGDVQKNYAAIQQDLMNSGLVTAVTRTSSPITEVWWKSQSPDWTGKPADLSMIISGLQADRHFTQTMGIRILDGRDFTGIPADSNAVLLNKAFVEAANLSQPVGMELRFGKDKFTVIGVTDNIVMESPFQPVDPMMVYYNEGEANVVSMRIGENIAMPKALAGIETIFKKHNTEFPFDYSFADTEFNNKFLTEELIGKITNIFAILAIFICSIGLAGLASFTIEKRFREIGIRKILGASIVQVLFLISREFLALVLIAFAIAVPLSWWLMYEWLQHYTFRISINVWVFISVGMLILLLAQLVVSIHTLKAAVTNPVKSLRSE